jgi:IclR family acetate operon transcriptional repressor
MPGPRSKTIQSVDRAIALLRAVADADGDLSLADLAQHCDTQRPTAWRLLWTLESNGLVEKVEHAVDSLARLAHPVLQELAREHEVTASLVYVQRLSLEYVDHVDGPLFTSPRWDGPLSLHASSPGKAVLAALPDAEWRAMVGGGLESLTETTITTLDAFESEITRAREQGYAVCHGEDVTYSNGASAAVLHHGRPIAAIDLWGSDRRVADSRLNELRTAAAEAAARMADALP